MDCLPEEIVEIIVRRVGPECAPVCKLFSRLVRQNVTRAVNVVHPLPPLPNLRTLQLVGNMQQVPDTVETLDVSRVETGLQALEAVPSLRIRRREVPKIRHPERVDALEILTTGSSEPECDMTVFRNLLALKTDLWPFPAFTGLTRLDLETSCTAPWDVPGPDALRPLEKMSALRDVTLRGIRCCDCDSGRIGLDRVPGGVTRLHVLVEYGRGEFGELDEYSRLVRLESLCELSVPRIPVHGVPEKLHPYVANTRGGSFFHPMHHRRISAFDFFVT